MGIKVSRPFPKTILCETESPFQKGGFNKEGTVWGFGTFIYAVGEIVTHDQLLAQHNVLLPNIFNALSNGQIRLNQTVLRVPTCHLLAWYRVMCVGLHIYLLES